MTENSMPEHSARFSVGGAISSSFGIYFSNFVFFTVLAAIFLLPEFFVAIIFPVVDLSYGGAEFLVGGVLTSIAVSIVSIGFMTSISLYAVVSNLRGQPTKVGDVISNGLGRVGFAIVAIIVTTIGVILGYLLLVIPGLIAMCMFFVAVPAATLEKVGPFEAISRSRFLTEGYRWSIFGIVIIFGIFNYLVEFIAGSVVSATASSSFDQQYSTMLWLTYILYVPSTALQAIVAGYTYTVLSAEKDGRNFDQIAAAFD